jgi:hypothetical protein
VQISPLCDAVAFVAEPPFSGQELFGLLRGFVLRRDARFPREDSAVRGWSHRFHTKHELADTPACVQKWSMLNPLTGWLSIRSSHNRSRQGPFIAQSLNLFKIVIDHQKLPAQRARQGWRFVYSYEVGSWKRYRPSNPARNSPTPVFPLAAEAIEAHFAARSTPSLLSVV